MLEQDVNGVPHVLVPKDVWDDILVMFNEIQNKQEWSVNNERFN